MLTLSAGENNLSFIETSALDASNVELAFQNILTGTSVPYPQRIAATIVVGAKLQVALSGPRGHVFTPPLLLSLQPQMSFKRAAANTTPEIYRIVSSKALDQGEGSGPVLGNDRKVLEISKSADAEQKKGCC